MESNEKDTIAPTEAQPVPVPAVTTIVPDVPVRTEVTVPTAVRRAKPKPAHLLSAIPAYSHSQSQVMSDAFISLSVIIIRIMTIIMIILIIVMIITITIIE